MTDFQRSLTIMAVTLLLWIMDLGILVRHHDCLYCFVLSSASDVVTVSFGVSLYSVSTLLDFASVISIYVSSVKVNSG